MTETPLHRDPPWTRNPLDRDPPPVNRITDRCKNITFPQLRLRAVMKHNLSVRPHYPILFTGYFGSTRWEGM